MKNFPCLFSTIFYFTQFFYFRLTHTTHLVVSAVTHFASINFLKLGTKRNRSQQACKKPTIKILGQH